MDPVRNPSSLEATGAFESDVQLLMPVSDAELVVPTIEAVWGASPIPAAQPVALFSSGIFLG